jgi:hypothetical protein
VFQATDFRDCETDEGNPLIDIFGISKVCRASSFARLVSHNMQDGCPVIVTIDDFYPYFYIPAREGFTDAD